MTETDGSFSLVGLAAIIFLAGLLVGGWFGKLQAEVPEEIYVFESRQPVRAIFDKELPNNDEIESFTVTKGYGDDAREYIFYYWVEKDAVDGSMRKQLHWTWREVTGP